MGAENVQVKDTGGRGLSSVWKETWWKVAEGRPELRGKVTLNSGKEPL